MTYFVLSRRLRSGDNTTLKREEEPHLIVLGKGLLSDFGGIPEKTKIFALQEEVKETGLMPQFEGSVELKVGGELVEMLLSSQLIHL